MSDDAVERYEPEWHWRTIDDPEARMSKEATGNWVKFADYERLRAQLATAQTELDAVNQDLDMAVHTMQDAVKNLEEVRAALATARKDERERCAKVCDELIASAIRALGDE